MLGGVDGALALIDIVFPLTDTHHTISIQQDAEAVTLALVPHAVVGSAFNIFQYAVSLRNPLTVGLALIGAVVHSQEDIHRIGILMQQGIGSQAESL